MGQSKPWHEQEGFWETSGPNLLAGGQRFATPEQTDRAAGLLEFEPGPRILDLCCGSGTTRDWEALREQAWESGDDRGMT